MRVKDGAAVLAAAAALVPLAAAAPAKAPTRLVAVLSGSFEPESTAALTVLDPLSLERTQELLPLGEYAGGYAFSPDGTKVAVSTAHDDVLEPGRVLSARRHIPFGATLVDLVRMRRIAGVKLGWSATAFGWFGNDRLLATVGNDAVVVDAGSGAVLRRIKLGDSPRSVVPTADGVAAIVGRRLAMFDARANVRFARLRRGYGTEARLAVDPQVRYRRTRPRIPNLLQGAAVFAADGKVVIGGGSAGPGVWLLDTRTWRLRLVDRVATRFALGPKLVLTYGREPGLKAFDLDGSFRLRLFEGSVVATAVVSEDYAYVRLVGDATQVHVVDLAGERVVAVRPVAPNVTFFGPQRLLFR
jgi:hypothetical protein